MPPSTRETPKPTLETAEYCGLTHDAHIAPQCQLEPASYCISLNGGDRRFPDLKPGEAQEPIRGVYQVEAHEICPCTERIPRPRQNPHQSVVVGVEASPCLTEGDSCCAVYRVLAFWPVDRDDNNIAISNIFDRHVGLPPGRSRQSVMLTGARRGLSSLQLGAVPARILSIHLGL